jgi:hypothetical protein
MSMTTYASDSRPWVLLFVWNDDSVKLYKFSIVLNNPKNIEELGPFI